MYISLLTFEIDIKYSGKLYHLLHAYTTVPRTHQYVVQMEWHKIHISINTEEQRKWSWAKWWKREDTPNHATASLKWRQKNVLFHKFGRVSIYSNFIIFM